VLLSSTTSSASPRSVPCLPQPLALPPPSACYRITGLAAPWSCSLQPPGRGIYMATRPKACSTFLLCLWSGVLPHPGQGPGTHWSLQPSVTVCLLLCHFLQANSEVSALLGRIPSAVGYQPTLATDLGGLQERITTTKKGSITSVQAIYVPADDLTDPAPATTFRSLGRHHCAVSPGANAYHTQGSLLTDPAPATTALSRQVRHPAGQPAGHYTPAGRGMRLPGRETRCAASSLTAWQAPSLVSVLVRVRPLQISELGIYPAVDPLDSSSRMLSPHPGWGPLQLRPWCPEGAARLQESAGQSSSLPSITVLQSTAALLRTVTIVASPCRARGGGPYLGDCLRQPQHVLRL